jgi:hypothetical protein
MNESKEQQESLMDALRELKARTRQVRSMGEDVAKVTKDKTSRHVDQIAALLGLAEENLSAAMDRMQVVNVKKQSIMLKSRESNRFKAIQSAAPDAHTKSHSSPVTSSNQ